MVDFDEGPDVFNAVRHVLNKCFLHKFDFPMAHSCSFKFGSIGTLCSSCVSAEMFLLSQVHWMSALDVLIAWKLKLYVLLLFFSSCDWTLLRCLCTSHPKENPKRRTPMIFKGTHLLNKHNLKWNTWSMLYIAFSCFLCRMGFSAEQLAKWVAERTDVHVGSFYVIFFR